MKIRKNYKNYAKGENMKRVSLIQLKANRKGKVVEILGGTNLNNKLMHMGIFKGKEIAKLSHIGLRGPVVIKTGRSILALGHSVAAKVMLEQE
jgi:Fe2+ transport system protein FeoA